MIEMVSMFAMSLRQSNPQATLEVITDHDTVIEYGTFDVLHRSKIDHRYIMLERLRKQIEIVEASEIGDKLAFLDTDILTLSDLTTLFDDSFDVAVTIDDNRCDRSNVRNIYNNGVLFVNCRNREFALDYLQLMREKLESLDPDLWAWSGNEYIVAEILGIRTSGEIVRIGHANIAILPCSKFNYTPESIGEDVSERRILHFCGRAKSFMWPYASDFGWT